MEIDAKAPEGNAFAIMGFVRDILKQVDRLDEWPVIQERMISGDYDNLCSVAEETTHGSIKIINRDGEE